MGDEFSEREAGLTRRRTQALGREATVGEGRKDATVTKGFNCPGMA